MIRCSWLVLMRVRLGLLGLALGLVIWQFPVRGWAQKGALQATLNEREPQLWETAQKIWTWAEPGYQERKSAEALAGMLESAGFRVERGVAEIPTAFTATCGSRPPVIGILGEYDALPGLAQEAVPERQPRPGSGYGHGCGHHLFGVASAGAALALGAQIQSGKLVGTVRFYGCPAEEGGSAKVFMVRAGLFRDCDAVLHWHPASMNVVGERTSLARDAVKFRFHGVSAHAAGAPEQGRSALDAVELTNFGAELLREHTPDRTRIHHVITQGGAAPNVVPDFAEVYYYVRHPQADVVRTIYDRLVKCAQAGALATETRLEIKFEGGIVELLPNRVLSQVIEANLRQCNDLKYTPGETRFAQRIQLTLAKPEPLDSVQRVYSQAQTVGMGSTDVGDVSWVVPTAGFTTACFVPGTPGHTWQAVAAGGMSIGRRGMDLAARVLAASAYDLMTRPDVLAAAKQEHRERLSKRSYRPLTPADMKPPLDYRQALER